MTRRGVRRRRRRIARVDARRACDASHARVPHVLDGHFPPPASPRRPSALVPRISAPPSDLTFADPPSPLHPERRSATRPSASPSSVAWSLTTSRSASIFSRPASACSPSVSTRQRRCSCCSRYKDALFEKHPQVSRDGGEPREGVRGVVHRVEGRRPPRGCVGRLDGARVRNERRPPTDPMTMTVLGTPTEGRCTPRTARTRWT